jgi:hypothetical protein
MMLKNLLLKNGSSEDSAVSIVNFLSSAGKNKKIRSSIAKYNEQQDGKMMYRLRKCCIKMVIESIITGNKPKFVSCAGSYAHQVSIFSPNTDAVKLFGVASNRAIGIAANIRMRKKHLRDSKLTAEFLKKYPDINPSALEYLYFKDKLALTKDDFETLDTFLSLAVKKKEV